MKSDNLREFSFPLTIFISGLDGAGKTTHARKLVAALSALGLENKYVWMSGRGRVLFSFYLLVLCRLLRITRVHKLENGLRVSEYPFYAYKPIRVLWPWLQLVDSIIYSTICINIPLFFSNSLIIVVERNVIDTFVDVLTDTHNSLGLKTLQKLFLALLPENALVIVLDVDEKVAISRKRDILHIDYLKIRRRLYKSLSRKYGWRIISTEGRYADVHGSILKLVTKALMS